MGNEVGEEVLNGGSEANRRGAWSGEELVGCEDGRGEKSGLMID